MCRWGSRGFWCTYRWYFVQLRGGIVFLPSEGDVEKVSWEYFTAGINLTEDFVFGSFFCAMIAAITLRLLDPFGTGKLVLFQVTYDKVGMVHEYISFLRTGLRIYS